MDFVANGSKNVEIETSTGVYLRHAIQTHFVEIGEDYIELVNRYVKPLYEEGDLLSISEKIIALCQKRVVYRKDMKISWLAKFLSRFAIQHNSAGIGVGEVCKMQFAIDECGAWKVLWAAICAGFGKLVGKHGIFYDMVGMEVTGLDGFYPDVFPVYGDYGIRIPENPSGVCNEIYEKTGVRAMIVDANDFTRDILGKGDNVTLTDEQLQALTSEELLDKIKAFANLEHTVLYYGPKSGNEVVADLKAYHKTPAELTPVAETVRTRPLLTPENRVIMAEYDAKQIYFLQISNRGETFDPANDAAIALYNAYFGGGMNAIVFQEMREARSLAYTAQAFLSQPGRLDRPYMYMAFIATQNDKMQKAIEAFDEIINLSLIHISEPTRP